MLMSREDCTNLAALFEDRPDIGGIAHNMARICVRIEALVPEHHNLTGCGRKLILQPCKLLRRHVRVRPVPVAGNVIFKLRVVAGIQNDELDAGDLKRVMRQRLFLSVVRDTGEELRLVDKIKIVIAEHMVARPRELREDRLHLFEIFDGGGLVRPLILEVAKFDQERRTLTVHDRDTFAELGERLAIGGIPDWILALGIGDVGIVAVGNKTEAHERKLVLFRRFAANDGNRRECTDSFDEQSA